MGRKKIKIQPIKEDRNRSVTYLKRKAGLFKKAHELAVLTDSQVAVIVFGHNGKLAEFCSTDIDLLLLRYTEYEGPAERKGPQHYLHLDKDSDDNDGDNDDNDNASRDGPDDDFHFGGHSGANGRGPSASGANGSHARRVTGVKRKAEPLSPQRNNRTLGSNRMLAAQDLGAFDVAPAGAIMAVAPSAKQTVNAAIRHKSQIRSGGNMAAASSQLSSQGMFDPLSFGQPWMPAAGGMQHNIVGGAMGGMGPSMSSSSGYFGAGSSMTGQAQAGPSSFNPTRAQSIANMSIPMPSNDRLPIFVSPATPGFGLTPGGTVTTPGGRRFSFSDVMTRGSDGSMLQRPVTANSFLTPSFFNNEVFGMSATPPAVTGEISSTSPSVTPQPPPQGATMDRQATLQPAGGNASSVLETSPTPLPDPRQSAQLMSRPASTGVAPTYNEARYTAAPSASLASSSTLASPAHITRPLTALANLEAPASATHLVPPAAGFPGPLGGPELHASSASPMPPHVSSIQAVPNASFTASSYPSAAADLKASSTPLSSATPELIQNRVKAASVSHPGPGASASRSSISTDEETPPGNNFIPDSTSTSSNKLDPNTAWLGMAQTARDAKTGQASLVQPLAINAAQTIASVPFDLNFSNTGT
ncbi:related to RLM1 - MADS-box transcription factor [Ustilago sp. UG-2017a]|nr:related to RLM1 - MADS-box transcription factor [Ustilago sp. UG-2017a]